MPRAQPATYSSKGAQPMVFHHPRESHGLAEIEAERSNADIQRFIRA